MADSDKPKKKGGKLKWILLIFFILLLGGGGAGAWYYFFSGLPGSRGAASTTASAPKAAAGTSASKNLQTAALEPFLVNLADPLGKRYIKLTIEVELASPEVADELSKQRPKIRDGVIMLLSSKTYADLATAESKLTLQNEIVARLNQILGGPKVVRVFFTDLVIQ